MKENKRTWTKWFYWFTFAVATIAVYKTLDSFVEIGNWTSEFLNTISPFIIGIIISYILYLPTLKIERLYQKVKKIAFISKHARGLSVFTIYLFVVLFIFLLFKFVVPTIATSGVDLINNFQQYYAIATEKISHLPEDSILKNEVFLDWFEEVKKIDFKQYINVDKLMQYAQGAISFATGILDFFISIIVSIYILISRKEILEFLRKLTKAVFRKNTYESVRKYFNGTSEIFFKFLASQLLDAAIVGVLVSIALLVLDVKYAVLLGFMIGLFNIIPYFGAIIATVIAALITILTGGISQAIWMVVVVIILQQIDANIINPKIIGNNLKLNPLLVIFSVSVGGAYFGVMGMFLAVPIIAVVKLIVLEYVESRQ